MLLLMQKSLLSMICHGVVSVKPRRLVVWLYAALAATCMGLAAPAPGSEAKWVSGYYSRGTNSMSPTEIPWDKYTHIIHFAVAPAVDQNKIGNGEIEMFHIQAGDIKALMAARPAERKVLLSVKDNDPHPNAFLQSTSPSRIAQFVDNIAALVTQSGYDGVDLDWEKNVNTSQYSDLIVRLKRALGDKLVTIAVGDWENLDVVAAKNQSLLDQINVMCYDMDGGDDCDGQACAWHLAAMFQGADKYSRTCEQRVKVFADRGVEKKKIGIGLPFYGRVWTGVTTPGTRGHFQKSTVTYQELVRDPRRWQAAFERHDDQHAADYLSIDSRNEFISYVGPTSIDKAVSWLYRENFGGIFAFSLQYEYLPLASNSDARYPLSTALNDALNAHSPCAMQADARLSVRPGGFRFQAANGRYLQVVSVYNTTDGAIYGPLWLALESLSSETTLWNNSGIMSCSNAGGVPYIVVKAEGDRIPARRRSAVILEFAHTASTPITYVPRVLSTNARHE